IWSHLMSQHDSGAARGSYGGYIIGYCLSLLFTLDSYLVVTKHLYANGRIMTVVAGLAILQLIVQLVFFLHLGKGSKARWNVIVFVLMIFLVILVVFGSLWIMQH